MTGSKPFGDSGLHVGSLMRSGPPDGCKKPTDFHNANCAQCVMQADMCLREYPGCLERPRHSFSHGFFTLCSEVDELES